MAYYPEAVYAIVSLMQSDSPVMRAFRLIDNRISEVAFSVMASGASATCSPLAC